ncbi:ABC transporter substrate-binding protein [Acetonema longum]|uniref:ABC transporter substrate binding protein n=1 Tax=Acetonema longum DSM 6540 TaxID=1009370 RepID=F7NQ60_9FIRM|nr:ABC transporter substrate-binding protein [Acetonema longum]EGO61819.1 hypothetical protein ALO_21304 [Acetonema longum DSM 6540]
MLTIGILQLTQHLDDAVRGFKAGLAQEPVGCDFHYVNADGNEGKLPELAQRLASLPVDMIFACSTPAAKAAVNLPGSIPVIYTPVFDPVGSGLAQSLAKPGGKATGVSGMVDAAQKAAFIYRLLPQANHLGMVYHAKDPNAVLESRLFSDAIRKRGGCRLTEIPIQQADELSLLYRFLEKDMDALFLPIGKAVEENFASVAYYTEAAAIPVIASHGPNVPAGALGGLFANHYQLGLKCAEKALKISQGVSAGDIPVDIATQPEIHLNVAVAAVLGISLPKAMLKQTAEIFE